MLAPRSRGALALGSTLTIAAALLAACGGSSEPTTTTNTNGAAAVSIVSGNGQTGLVGTALSLPLVVKVTSSTGAIVTGATVNFAVTSGAATVSPASMVTDASGQARTLVTFGSAAGSVTVTASVAGTALTATFNLTAGTTTVTTACSSSSPQSPAAGSVTTGVSGTGLCLTGGTSGADYTLVAFNSNPDSNLARASFTVRSSGILPLTTADVAPSMNVFPTPDQLGTNAQQKFDLHLRTVARNELTPLLPAARAWQRSLRQRSSSGASFNAIPSSVSVGQVLSLNANGLQACSSPINVGARVVAISNSAIVVADTANPTAGFTDAEYASFATTFDTLVNPLDVNAFGQPTDIDNNKHILILFTKEVNKLTPRGSEGVIGGFFFERDLFPVVSNPQFDGCAGSNVGEMFYVLVPDPTGQFSDVRSKSSVLSLTVSTLAHEYQHLINAGRRMYVNNADDFETVWLNEGLSHIAEELLYYRLSGKQPRQNLGVNDIINDQTTFFSNQGDNLARFQVFLGMPSQTGVYAANDSLETRGADWNLLRWLADHRAGTSSDADTWQRLDNSTTEGIPNLANVFGADIMTQIRDWATTVYSDDVPGVTDPRFNEPSWNHRSIFPHLCIDNKSPCTTLSKYPLQLTPISDQSPANVTVVAGGAAYIRFTVPAGANASIDWSAGGLPVSPLVQFTLVRSR